ncbi:MAG: hypothetical protein AVDCRST_MAG89-1357, partial [uncultured Gemmatimonadetes bacterium]
ARWTQGVPHVRGRRSEYRLQGREHALPLHHRARQDPAAADQRDVRAAPAAGGHRHQARTLPGPAAVHRRPRGV